MTEPKAVIVKTIGTVTKGADDAETDSGTFEVILSTPTEDRDGEEVKAEEWKTPLPDHITFDIDHGMSVATTVGSGVPEIQDDGKMLVKGRWASTPLAQQTRTLVNEGHIKTTSVAFLRLSGNKAAGGAKRELLNGAFVAVPANAEALVLNSKSLQEEMEEPDAIGKAAADAVEAALKALAGSYEERERAVYDAVDAGYSDPNNGVYAWPVATFDDSVVFRISGGDQSGQTWRSSYTMGDDGTAELGEATQVVITEVVTEVPTNSNSTASASLSAEPASKDADSAETDADDEEEAAEKAAAAAAENLRASLALGQ